MDKYQKTDDISNDGIELLSLLNDHNQRWLEGEQSTKHFLIASQTFQIERNSLAISRFVAVLLYIVFGQLIWCFKNCIRSIVAIWRYSFIFIHFNGLISQSLCNTKSFENIHCLTNTIL